MDNLQQIFNACIARLCTLTFKTRISFCREFEPQPDHITFAEIDHEITNSVIFVILLIRVGQLQVRYQLTAFIVAELE